MRTEDELSECPFVLIRDVGLGLAGAGISATAAARTSGLSSQTIEELMTAANVADRGGLSAAGRALQKHGGREGSAFPNPQGNPAAINLQGREIVVDILGNPQSTIVQRNTGRFGNVTDIVAPDGRGIRYDATGKFIGFLEPQKK